MDWGTKAILINVLEGRHFHKALDLGCGEGYYGELFKKHVDYLIGVDHSLSRLSAAKKFAGYDEVVYLEVQQYEIPADTEAVFMLEVLEHLPKNDGHTLLQKLRKVPFVFITTPAKFHSITLRNHHQSLWSESELQKYGFKTRKFRYSFPPFREGIAALRE